MFLQTNYQNNHPHNLHLLFVHLLNSYNFLVLMFILMLLSMYNWKKITARIGLKVADLYCRVILLC